MKASKDAHYQKMTQTPVEKLTLSLALPAVVSILITMVYNMADTWFVSRISTTAVAAVGVSFSITTFSNAVGFLFGMGSGTSIGRLLGAKKIDEASKIGSTGFFAAIFFCAALGAAALLCIKPLMRFLGASDAVLPEACAYGKYILMGLPVMCSSLVMSTILRCEGRTKLSMLGIGAGGVLNMALDPLLMFGLKLGVAGAAIATLISQCVSWALLLSFYLTGKSALRLSLRRASFRFETFRTILTTGFPSLCRHLISTLANIALNTSAGWAGGDTAIAAMAIVSKIVSLSLAVSTGVGQGAQTVFAYNKGAGLDGRVRRAFFFTLLFNTAQMAVICVALGIFARQILALFRADDPAVLQTGVQALRLQSVTILLTPWNSLVNQLFQSVGESGKSSVLASLRQGVYFIPAVFLLPAAFGVTGVLLAQPVADVLTALTVLPFLILYLKRTAGRMRALAA